MLPWLIEKLNDHQLNSNSNNRFVLSLKSFASISRIGWYDNLLQTEHAVL